MDIIYQTILLFVVGAAAGFLNVMAGGGSALTLPALIFLGLDSAMANGTNRIAILAQSIGAVLSFKKEKYQDYGLGIKMALITIPGSIIGALFALQISDKLFQILLGIINIFIIIMIFIPPKKIAQTEASQKITWQLALALFFIGIYGGFIQVAAGFLIMATLQRFLKVDLIWVNMYKVFIALFFTIPPFIIFLINGKMDFVLGLSLAVGNFYGAWQAAKISVKKGEKVIKYFLIIAIIIISLKLFGIF